MSFDKEAFLNTEVKGAMETTYTPVPEGEWPAYVKDLDMREVNDTPVLDLLWVVIDDRVKEQLGMDEPTVRQSLFLDVNENGTLEFGPNKNVQLGRIREVAGLNDPNKPFNFNMLRGIGPYSIKVIHNASQNDPERKYANVQRVAKLAA